MSAFNPQERETPASQSAIALYRISQAMGRLLRVRAEQAGLSPAQIQALLFLRYARPGVCTIGGLAERLAATYASASGVADALERKGLIQRQTSPDDQRVVKLIVTDRGREQAHSLENILDEVEQAIQQLPLEDQVTLVRATQAIVRQLQQAGHVQVYEMCWHCHFFRRDVHPGHPAGPHHCAFVDAPLPEANSYLECPDFVPLDRFE